MKLASTYLHKTNKKALLISVFQSNSLKGSSVFFFFFFSSVVGFCLFGFVLRRREGKENLRKTHKFFKGEKHIWKPELKFPVVTAFSMPDLTKLLFLKAGCNSLLMTVCLFVFGCSVFYIT